jgi:hypothetical protein
MKASVVFGILVILSCSGCIHLRRAPEGMAVIEVERQEDNGFVNIVPCTLILSDHQQRTLSGGEQTVVSVPSGVFYVEAFSIDPYSPGSDTKAWRSPRTRFHAAHGERLRISVEPAASGSTYTGGWTIRAADKILPETAAEP